MNRRGFLSLLGLSGVGLMVPKWMVYEPEMVKTALDGVSLHAITLETATELERALKGYKYTLAKDWTDDYGRIQRPEVLPHQYVDGRLISSNRPMVDFSLPQGKEVRWARTYAKPGAEALAEQIKASGMKYFASPKNSGWSNESVVVKAPGGLYVRGLVNRLGGDTIAFDLIGACV